MTPAPLNGKGQRQMFSRLLQIPRSLFPRIDLSVDEVALSQASDKQLQSELDQAAEQGMVATRSQDHTLDDVEVQDIIENGPPSDDRSNKRKSVGGYGLTPEQVGDKKRPRTFKSTEDEASTPTSTEPSNTITAEGSNGSSKRKHRQITQEEDMTMQDVVAASTPPPNASPPSTKRRPKAHAGQEVMKSVVINPLEGTRPAKVVPEEVGEVAQDLMTSQPVQRRKKSKEERDTPSYETSELDMGGLDTVAEPAKTKPSPAKAAKATHKRFGSEEVENLEPVLEAEGTAQAINAELSEESDDEAPEAVTVSAEKDKARTAALEAEKAAAQQEAAEKVKRREKDLRLKLQAKSSKKHSWLDEQLSAKVPKTEVAEPAVPNTVPVFNQSLLARTPEPEGTKITVPQATGATAVDEVEIPDMAEPVPEAATIIDEKQTFPVKPKSSGKAPLPALLPAEILAAEPVTGLPTPPLSVGKVPTNKKRKFLDTNSKPPKDLKFGKTKVRVLQDTRTALPPKASTNSKALRESWLMGRRGLKGALTVPRRKPSGGFVRK